MKTKLLLISALAISMTASAQITVSGSFGFANVSENTRLLDGKSYNGSELDALQSGLEFSPSVGYITGDYEFGGYLSLSSSKNTTRAISLIDNKTKSIGAGLYARRYFNIAGSLNFFVNASAGFGHDKTTNDTWGDAYITSNTWDIAFTPGFTYDFNEHWGIEADIDFIGLSWENSYDNAYGTDGKLAGNGAYTSTFNFGGTTSPGSITNLFNGISFGFYYVF